MMSMMIPIFPISIFTFNTYYSQEPKGCDGALTFQEENNVPKNCGKCGGDSRGEGEGQLHLQQSHQKGNYHVNT